MTDPRALLRACQVASGLSVPRYAEQRLGRSARCVNYWLSGERVIPPRMVAFLEHSAEYPRAMELLHFGDGEPDSPGASPTALPTP